MLGINTRLIASMKYALSLRNWTLRKFPHYPVRQLKFPAEPRLTVVVLDPGYGAVLIGMATIPSPTVALLPPSHVRPKPSPVIHTAVRRSCFHLLSLLLGSRETHRSYTHGDNIKEKKKSGTIIYCSTVCRLA